VPALTFWVSANFALANFLASRSLGNVSVALPCPRFAGGGSSNETYHVSWDLLYQPSEELTLFCKSTAAVILFCLTELIREIGDGRGGRATAGFRGG
jgi:hypothetical protein